MRKRRSESTWLPELEVTVRHQHLEVSIECEKRLEQILFRPESHLVENPILPHLHWKRNVMDMNDDAGFQTRDDLQKQIVDVTADPGHVRRINEQNVPGAQSFKDAEIDLLNGLSPYRRLGEPLWEPAVSKRVDARHPDAPGC